jgi:hypothetical protein
MANRVYDQGVATIGFDGGPSVVFRLNPNEVAWNFKVNTNVTETVGGRVVQVLGATLSDLTIKGSFGERRGATHEVSSVLAENFLAKMKEMAAFQSNDSSVFGKPMHQPAIFNFPNKNWKFAVYIKGLTDPKGGASITHLVGRASYDYVLTLFVHADLSDTAKILGASNGFLANQKNLAVQGYIDRIADGIGWHFSEFNGGGSMLLDQATNKATVEEAAGAASNAKNKRAAGSAGAGIGT